MAPGGGTWVAQNKRRPGAYINFISVPKPIGSLGSRGIVAVAMPMTWGDEDDVITLTGADLLSGASLSKVGVSAFDTEASLPFRLALSGCYTALLFRSDSGATVAEATLSAGSLTVSAKYSGTTGNDIKIYITADKPTQGLYEVQVLHKDILQETFTVSQLADFSTIESAWVDFEVPATPTTTTIPSTTGTPLTGAINGTVTSARYANFFAALEHKTFQTLAINSVDTAVMANIVAQINLWREVRGKKVQAVIYGEDSTPDYEGIISVHQGFSTAVDSVTTDLFPIWVASQTAGSEIFESLTAAVVPDAISIVNPILEDDIEGELADGHFVLTYRQDGAVCVEQDINSLTTFTVDKNYAFSKNRVIRTLDEIANNTALIFNRNYAGKVNNDAIGRNQFKSELISMFDTMVGVGAVTEFDGASDVTVLPGASVDSVVVDVTIQPVDSMEKLFMVVNVNA